MLLKREMVLLESNIGVYWCQEVPFFSFLYLAVQVGKHLTWNLSPYGFFSFVRMICSFFKLTFMLHVSVYE